MFKIKGDILSIPEGDGQGSIDLDLSNVNLAENRMPENAYLTAPKSPELQHIFNKATLDLSRYIAGSQLQLKKAEIKAKRVAAVLLLDKAQDILVAKGLAGRTGNGTKEQRDAVIELDPEFQMVTDKVAQLEAVVMLLEGKNEALSRAYYSARKVMDMGTHNRTNAYLELEENG